MKSVVIIEDEKLAAERLTRLLHEIDPDLHVIKVLTSVVDSKSFLASEKEYDLLFMDIHIADGNSFEIFDDINIDKPIIFITAFAEFALDAFKHLAVDYLLKPIKKQELHSAIEKWHFHFQKNSIQTDVQTQKYWKVKTGTSIKTIAYSEVLYYFSAEKITFLVTDQGKKYAIDTPLEKLESELNPKEYFRVNRQFIISRTAIREMKTTTKSRVIIKFVTNIETVVSTDRSPKFKVWLQG
jgi:two-component system, LytTR family, response regulator LytT